MGERETQEDPTLSTELTRPPSHDPKITKPRVRCVIDCATQVPHNNFLRNYYVL